MFASLRSYTYERRGTILKYGGFLGGAYLARNYIHNVLEDVREHEMQDQAARESLKRRFMQNQENIMYTIMALVPSLGDQILSEMDLDALTTELQSLTKAKKSPPLEPPLLSPNTEGSSLVSSLELLNDNDGHSDSGSMSLSSFSGMDESSMSAHPPQPSRGMSWVEADLTASQQPTTHDSLPNSLANSMITDISSLSSDVAPPNDLARSVTSDTSSASTSRSKAELWREVKILSTSSLLLRVSFFLFIASLVAFTRTLTTMYAVTLLSLFTTTQMTILARLRYVHSVIELEKDERRREMIHGMGPSSLLMGAFFGGGLPSFDVEDEEGELTGWDVGEIEERKFLTVSWWILHVGWKDIAERVRREVEVVFHDVSLKAKLGSIELHRLLNDVRRRVEHEVTFEGTERRIDFLSTLFPPTPETLQHTLLQGGIPPHLAAVPPTSYHSLRPSTRSQSHSAQDSFAHLLHLTHTTLSSPNFTRVLEVSLDAATGILLDSLEKNLFLSAGVGNDEHLTGSSTSGEEKLRLAGLLPGLGRWSYLALTGLPNELVDALLDVREVGLWEGILFAEFEDELR